MKIHPIYTHSAKNIARSVAIFAGIVAISLGIGYFGPKIFVAVRSLVTGEKVAGTMTDNAKNEAEDAFEHLAAPEPGTPQHLIIVGTNINAQVEFVGKDAEGFMETPKDPKSVGWYTFSSKTAEEGNIIINGHYDLTGGAPGVFWQLKSVKLGDTVTIIDEFNRPFDYKVDEIYYISISDPERFKIFNYADGSETLTLITCGGVWLPGESTYNKRLIVRAQRLD